jgi:hypothetical protein
MQNVAFYVWSLSANITEVFTLKRSVIIEFKAQYEYIYIRVAMIGTVVEHLDTNTQPSNLIFLTL